jgi:hypothetical protein
MLFDEDHVTRTHPKEKADLLQKQFMSVFSDPSKTNMEAALFPHQMSRIHSLTTFWNFQ